MVQEVGSPARRPYCVDENTERRNHYLDLAGIENYSSKFDDAGIKTSTLLSLLEEHQQYFIGVALLTMNHTLTSLSL